MKANRKVHAQRKFAQGAYIPPAINNNQPQVRHDVHHPPKEDNNIVHHKLSAKQMLDVVAFRSIHMHSTPVVLLQRLATLNGVGQNESINISNVIIPPLPVADPVERSQRKCICIRLTSSPILIPSEVFQRRTRSKLAKIYKKIKTKHRPAKPTRRVTRSTAPSDLDDIDDEKPLKLLKKNGPNKLNGDLSNEGNALRCPQCWGIINPFVYIPSRFKIIKRKKRKGIAKKSRGKGFRKKQSKPSVTDNTAHTSTDRLQPNKRQAAVLLSRCEVVTKAVLSKKPKLRGKASGVSTKSSSRRFAADTANPALSSTEPAQPKKRQAAVLLSRCEEPIPGCSKDSKGRGNVSRTSTKTSGARIVKDTDNAHCSNGPPPSKKRHVAVRPRCEEATPGVQEQSQVAENDSEEQIKRSSASVATDNDDTEPNKRQVAIVLSRCDAQAPGVGKESQGGNVAVPCAEPSDAHVATDNEHAANNSTEQPTDPRQLVIRREAAIVLSRLEVRTTTTQVVRSSPEETVTSTPSVQETVSATLIVGSRPEEPSTSVPCSVMETAPSTQIVGSHHEEAGTSASSSVMQTDPATAIENKHLPETRTSTPLSLAESDISEDFSTDLITIPYPIGGYHPEAGTSTQTLVTEAYQDDMTLEEDEIHFKDEVKYSPDPSVMDPDTSHQDDMGADDIRDPTLNPGTSRQDQDIDLNAEYEAKVNGSDTSYMSPLQYQDSDEEECLVHQVDSWNIVITNPISLARIGGIDFKKLNMERANVESNQTDEPQEDYCVPQADAQYYGNVRINHWLDKVSDPQGKESDPQGKESDLQGKESDLQGKESDPQGKESDLQGKESGLQEKESDPPGQESDLQGKESDPPGQECDLQGKESDPPGQENDLQGKESDLQEKERSDPQGKESDLQEKEIDPQTKENDPHVKERSDPQGKECAPKDVYDFDPEKEKTDKNKAPFYQKRKRRASCAFDTNPIEVQRLSQSSKTADDVQSRDMVYMDCLSKEYLQVVAVTPHKSSKHGDKSMMSARLLPMETATTNQGVTLVAPDDQLLKDVLNGMKIPAANEATSQRTSQEEPAQPSTSQESPTPGTSKDVQQYCNTGPVTGQNAKPTCTVKKSASQPKINTEQVQPSCNKSPVARRGRPSSAKKNVQQVEPSYNTAPVTLPVISAQPTRRKSVFQTDEPPSCSKERTEPDKAEHFQSKNLRSKRPYTRRKSCYEPNNSQSYTRAPTDDEDVVLLSLNLRSRRNRRKSTCQSCYQSKDSELSSKAPVSENASLQAKLRSRRPSTRRKSICVPDNTRASGSKAPPDQDDEDAPLQSKKSCASRPSTRRKSCYEKDNTEPSFSKAPTDQDEPLQTKKLRSSRSSTRRKSCYEPQSTQLSCTKAPTDEDDEDTPLKAKKLLSCLSSSRRKSCYEQDEAQPSCSKATDQDGKNALQAKNLRSSRSSTRRKSCYEQDDAQPSCSKATDQDDKYALQAKNLRSSRSSTRRKSCYEQDEAQPSCSKATDQDDKYALQAKNLRSSRPSTRRKSCYERDEAQPSCSKAQTDEDDEDTPLQAKSLRSSRSSTRRKSCYERDEAQPSCSKATDQDDKYALQAKNLRSSRPSTRRKSCYEQDEAQPSCSKAQTDEDDEDDEDTPLQAKSLRSSRSSIRRKSCYERDEAQPSCSKATDQDDKYAFQARNLGSSRPSTRRKSCYEQDEAQPSCSKAQTDEDDEDDEDTPLQAKTLRSSRSSTRRKSCYERDEAQPSCSKATDQVDKNALQANLRSTRSSKRRKSCYERDEAQPSCSKAQTDEDDEDTPLVAMTLRSTKLCSRRKSECEPYDPKPCCSLDDDEVMNFRRRSPVSIPRGFNSAGNVIDAPVLYLTDADYNMDPMPFLQNAMRVAAEHGICKIVATDKFKSKCMLSNEGEFGNSNQFISRLYTRWGPAVRELSAIKACLKKLNVPFDHSPRLYGSQANLPKLYHLVQRYGGLNQVIASNLWPQIAEEMRLKCRPEALDTMYVRCILPYDSLQHHERQQFMSSVEKAWTRKNQKLLDCALNPLHTQKKILGDTDSSEDEEPPEEPHLTTALKAVEDCIVQGRPMPLLSFQKVANNTEDIHDCIGNTPEQIEDRYWRLVLMGSEHVCVHNAYMDASKYGYGFPRSYNSPWNFKKFGKNKQNVLGVLGSVMGLTVPTIHLGMLFSTSCWNRDPHGLPWIEYMHSGPPKIWYGIPDSQSANFRHAVETLCPAACQNKSVWLPSDVTMIPPNMLADHNVTLTRVEQNPNEFVLVVPKAYSCTISTGFTVSESVYFAGHEWLDTVLDVFQELRDNFEPSFFSLEHMLMSLGRTLYISRETRVTMHSKLSSIVLEEISNREKLIARGMPTRKAKHQSHYVGTWDCSKLHECQICRTTLYLSEVQGFTTDAKVEMCLQHSLRILDRPKYRGKSLASFKLIIFFPNDQLEEIVKDIAEKL